MGRIAAVVLMFGLAACTASGPDVPAPTASSAVTSAAVTTTAAGPCTDDAAMGRVVRAFLAAYNAGEAGLADRFFAPAGTFRWYSEYGRRQGGAAYDRSTVDRYLATRHAEGDRLTLVRLTRSGESGDFGFWVRHAGAAGPVLSKGAVDCATGRFVVLSVGPNPGP